MIKLYGIPNCDTMKKARLWLTEHQIPYEFHDYKKQGLDEGQLRAWVAELGWEALLNRKGQLWRKLPAEVREGMDEGRAIRTMLEQPGIIRRPLLELADGRHRVGFDAAAYEQLF
jgi:Spx/MgsR family transcriptional regulator